MSIQEQKPSKRKTLREKKLQNEKSICECRKILSSLICLQRGERGQMKYLIIMFTITASTLHYTRDSSQCSQAKKELKGEEREEILKRRNQTTFIYRQYDHLCRISIGIWKKN